MKNAIILLIICAVIPALASATYLQIIPILNIPDIVTNENTTIPITVVNNGDETARNVRLTLLLPEGFTSQDIFIRELQPNQTVENTFRLQAPANALPGTYVLSLLTNYADANEYPFSSINSAIMNYRTPTSSAVSGFMNNLDLGKEPGTLNITVRNREEREYDVEIKLLLPDELKASQIKTRTRIGPNQERQIQATISSSGALPGSTYPVIATATYEENSQQHSSVIRGVITIKQTTTNPMPIPIWLPPALLAVIIAVLIYRRI